MKFILSIVGALLVIGIQVGSSATFEEQEKRSDTSFVDGSDLRAQMTEREGKILKLSTEEQLQLRAAQLKAAEDPDVKVAVEKRDRAMEEFRQAFRKSLIKSDPKIEAVLDKIAIGTSPGF